jgi:8-oxo-dGTP pyrophosphatase MutT (NUDIX family)
MADFFAVPEAMIWTPHTTVAAIIEQNNKFLLVEEETAEGIRINQPAGHLEDGETLLEAVIREAHEETAHHFQPEHLLGIYHWRSNREVTYLRFAFIGKVTGHDSGKALDEGIIRATWMTLEEIRNSRHMHRSPQVMTCIEHYLSGQRFPLSTLTHL